MRFSISRNEIFRRSAEMKEARKSDIATVVFTDIIGYAKLMKSDEDSAFELFAKNKALHQEIIGNKGKSIQEVGDKNWLVFEDTSDAIDRAVELLDSWDQIKTAKIRIGMYTGEIAEGKLVAEAIGSMAPGGAIYASEIIARNVAERKDLTVKYMGEQELKQVGYPIRLHKITRNSFPKMTLKSTRVFRYSFLTFLLFVIVFSIFSAVKGCESRSKMQIEQIDK